ncbi:MAG: 3'(2'),5'-bisphosphate nucleotidase CysQ [Hyphomicrobiales bacterium]|nr:3'(2'),5'-bisphosphate nucleotidase CysQ [Hyphomicrobiales bacterium]
MTLAADSSPSAIADALLAAAREAGALAMTWFREGAATAAQVSYKAGGSPVTEADLAVDAFLRERLGAQFRAAGWLSEETADSQERLSRTLTLVVDPIDGTRGYAQGDRRWAVALAVVLDGRPVAGVIEAPALGETYRAAAGAGATLNGRPLQLSATARLAGGLLAGPKTPGEALAAAAGMHLAPKTPSLAVRFAHVASGAFDAAGSSPNAHDWDIAAADLVLREAGGLLTDIGGRAPLYNRINIKHDALYAAPAASHAQLLEAALRDDRTRAAHAARQQR